MRRFSLRFLRAQPLGPLRLGGQRIPGGLGPAAPFAHVVERRRFRLGPRLIGTGEEELEKSRSTRLTPPAGRSLPLFSSFAGCSTLASAWVDFLGCF